MNLDTCFQVELLKYLLDYTDLQEEDIMVLSPYTAQCTRIRRRILEERDLADIHVGSVVTSQGLVTFCTSGINICLVFFTLCWIVAELLPLICASYQFIITPSDLRVDVKSIKYITVYIGLTLV